MRNKIKCFGLSPEQEGARKGIVESFVGMDLLNRFIQVRSRRLLFMLIFLTGFWSCSENKPCPCKRKLHASDIIIQAGDSTDQTNDYFDNENLYPLRTYDIVVKGEVEHPGKVDFQGMSLQSLIVKELVNEHDSDVFAGAFRYRGYALREILNTFHIRKKNAAGFRPLTDLYVEIGNEKGEKVVLSWGEIFFANRRNDILITTQVMPVYPARTQPSWTFPRESKLVIGHDFYSSRNISKPTTISIRSYPIDLRVIKGKNLLYSPEVEVFDGSEKVEILHRNPGGMIPQTMDMVFYGRGLGLHSTHPFTGVDLGEYWRKLVRRTPDNIRRGLVVIAADDGYRAVYSYSEICNRSDGQKLLLVCRPEQKNRGIFSIYPGFDFFSDRAVSAVNMMRYIRVGDAVQ